MKRSWQHFYQSIVSHTLIAVGIRISLVIAILTTASYYHIFSKIESSKLEELQSFSRERAARESQIFKLAEDNHQIMKTDILQSLAGWNRTDLLTDFEKKFIRQQDQAIRYNPSLFDANNIAGSWMAGNVPLTEELKFRFALLNILVTQYGKSWRNRFINTYVLGSENYASVYWPEIPDFSYRLESDFDIRGEEYFLISTNENNPERKTVWTGVYRDKQSDIWMVSVETPIYYLKQHIGTIGNDMSLVELFERTINVAPQGGYNMIFREDGRLIAHSDYTDKLKSADGNFVINQDGDESLRAIYQAVMTKKTESKMIELEQNDSYLMVSKLSGPGWYYVSVIPKSIVSNIASNTAVTVFVSGIIALAFELLVLFFVIKRKIAKPLSQLNRATLALSNGTEAEEIDILRADELGRLARSFNIMNRNLLKRDSQLATTNRILEEQLQQLTLSQSGLAQAQAVAKLGSWKYDNTNNQLILSSELLKLLKLEEEQVEKMSLRDLFARLNPKNDGEASKIFEQFLKQQKDFSFRHEFYFTQDNDSQCVIHLTGQSDSVGDLLTGTVQDLSEQYQAKQAMQESEKLFRNVFHNSTISMAVVNLDGNILQANEHLCHTFGYSANEIKKINYVDLVHPNEKHLSRGKLGLIAAGKDNAYDAERILVCRDGTQIHCHINVFVQQNQQGNPDYIFIQCIDISLRKEAEKKLNQLAFHDPLTGLANRTLFIEFLNKAIKYYHRDSGQSFALLFLDLDGFKFVNDSLGHLEGDKLLVAISERLTHEIRDTDTLARFGGDEFCILLEDVNSENQVIELAKRINSVLGKPFLLNSESINTNASIGIVFASKELNNSQDYLRDADSAMYHAKREGRGCFAIFNSEMHQSAKRQLRLRNELNSALESQQFLAHYQPIMNARSGKLKGFEALVRWNHPQRGLLSPAEFLTVAEDMHRIAEIDYLMLEEAVAALSCWQKKFSQKDLTISCNASSDLISTYQVVGKIEALLIKHDLSPRCLNIEVTENVLINDPETTMKILVQLQQLGVNIHLDDFGTGFSSLSYLHRFPIHNIKIDRSFVKRLTDGEKDHAIVESIVLLANRLGITVTAEGVETKEQHESLKVIGVNTTQGYYHGRPFDVATATKVIQENNLEKAQ
jgi:diguanylate cyclase (GGDEF)-like protein/PAS domain S-box-containing protein